MVRQERLGNLIADREHRVERALRFLKNHPDLAPANFAHFGFADLRQIAPFKEHLPFRDERRRHRQQPHDRVARDRFAAARFAHQRNAFTLLDVERNPVDRARNAGIGLEMRMKILNLKQAHDGLRH